MSINAVSSSTSAAAKAVEQPKPQAKNLKTEVAKPNPEAAKTPQAKPAEKPAEPKPVVNTQGQTTGQRLHVTA